MTLISSNVNEAAQFLNEGKLVGIPTETVYGLAANIYNEAAVKGIFELKQRPLFNPLIVHIHSLSQLDELAEELPENAKLLAAALWPGELTLVVKKKAVVPDLITAGKDTVAVRMPKHPLVIQLLQYLDFPLAAPSANPFGSISPTTAQRVKDYFEGKLPMVLDGGPCSSGIESTIVGFEGEEAILYRLGAISVEEIEGVVGAIKQQTKNEKSPEAPGMLFKHYSPKTPLLLSSDIKATVNKFLSKKVGVLVFNKEVLHPSIKHQEVLSEKQDFKEAAANLYEALHRLDHANLDLILAERLPNRDLGKSINDRLERAAAAN